MASGCSNVVFVNLVKSSWLLKKGTFFSCKNGQKRAKNTFLQRRFWVKTEVVLKILGIHANIENLKSDKDVSGV